MTSKTQRWEWAIGLKLEELSQKHLQAAYKLNWDNLCKFDSCRKNCKKILCLACFDRSWIDNDSANNSGYDNFDTTDCEQKRSNPKSFVGLKNLGATCYVNCLLQLWFHNPALRKAIYEWNRDCGSIKEEKNTQPRAICNERTQSSSIKPSKLKLEKSPPKSNQNSKPLTKSSQEKANNNNNANEHDDKQSNTAQETKLTTATTLDVVSQEKSHQPKDGVHTNAIEQLQLIFARLQFTNKKSIDPYNFIDSLALNAAEQQDAQEFGNLFMGLLEDTLANQKSSFVSKIIQNQFSGCYTYATICDHCKHSSLSDSKFYYLHLKIQNLETLHDCLEDYFRPESLDGKYNCSQCQQAQSAHRKTILKSLPPTLNLQLMRFVYDKQRNVRQKLNSYITFPEILDMTPYFNVQSNSKTKGVSYDLSVRNNNNSSSNNNNNSNNNNSDNYLTNGYQRAHKSNIYILSAVLIHRGSSPHSGHYIAHIKDRITKDWYKFNDDSVERIGPQLQVSTDGENISVVEGKSEIVRITDSFSGKVAKLESKSLRSKTAYMLVYQAQDNEALTYPSDQSEKWVLPDHLQLEVAEENSRSEQIFESLQIAKEVDIQVLEMRKVQIKMIYDKLVCRDPTDKFEFMDKNWLQNWLTNSSSSAKFPSIDNSGLLCQHDKLDFRKLDQVKCIRSDGADLLYQEYGGGPRLRDSMCRECVELEVKLIQIKERLKEDQKFITSQAKFKLDANYDFADAYIVGKNSYRDWQALVMHQFEKSNPELLSRKRDRPTNNNNQNSSDEDDHKTDRTSCDHSESVNRNSNNNNNTEDNCNSESDEEAMEKFVFNSDILCEHNQLINDTSAWRIVPKEVWNIFKNYFGNDPTRPLIESNANTIMCAECKKQEVEQQGISDTLKQKALEQKTKLPDLFHNRKRASWCSMLPNDEYYALDRQFLTKWQKFIRNPCNQEQPEAIKNVGRILCEHGRSLYNYTNSNPILPECPFVLVSGQEFDILNQYYPIEGVIKFTIDNELADHKLKLYLASQKNSKEKKTANSFDSSGKQLDNSGGDHTTVKTLPMSTNITNDDPNASINPLERSDDIVMMNLENDELNDQLDLSDIDWSECVVSEPDYCSDCHEMLIQDELKKLLNYESATIYITKVENSTVFGPQTNPNPSANASNGANDNCDNEADQTNDMYSQEANKDPLIDVEVVSCEESYPKRRKKVYIEDEANDFVPPGAARQSIQPSPASSSILRRTTRRNRNREQAYTIRPTETLLELKKEIFSRCQVLPVDQRLFLNDVLLDDNSKTMSELRIVPNCSLKLEIDRPLGENIDLIEDEQMSRKSLIKLSTQKKGKKIIRLCNISRQICFTPDAVLCR